MKRKLLLTILGLAVTMGISNAQVSGYVFTQTAGTYAPISGGTSLVTGTADDNTYGALPIGFTFRYNGVNYTQFGLNINGWISMGPAVPTSSYVPLNTGTTNNVISALGRDLQLGFIVQGTTTLGSVTITGINNTAGFVVGEPVSGTGIPIGATVASIGVGTIDISLPATASGTTSVTATLGGEVRYQTQGAAPFRTLTVQWTRARQYFNSAGDLFLFQIILYETYNRVEVSYGPFFTASAASAAPQVGLRGNTNADFNDRTGTPWSASTAGATNAVTMNLSATSLPTSGQLYRWYAAPTVPPNPTEVVGVPTCASGTQITVAGTPPAGINWYWQGTNPSGTSMVQDYTTNYTAFTNGTYYLRAYEAASGLWSTTSSSVVISSIPVATAPPAPVAGANPACYNTTLTEVAPPAGISYWWQGTNPTGTSTANPSTTPYSVSATNTYYVSAYDSVSGCWSSGTGLLVNVVTTVTPTPTSPVGAVVCSGASSAPISVSPGPSSTTAQQITSFGTNLQSPGPATNFNIVVAALPPGATIISTKLRLTNVNSINGSWRSEARVALSGATTLAATQLSILNSGGLISPDPLITIPNLPVGGGAVTLTLSESYDDGGAGTIDATYGNAEIVITYALPTAVSWWDAPSGGVNQGATNPLEAVGTPFLPNTSTPGTYSFYAQGEDNGCPSTSRLQVDVVVNPVLVTLDPINVTCNGAGNGSFAINTVVCGLAPFDYSVDGGPFGAIPTNLTPGNYSVVVRDANLLSASPINITITEPSWVTPDPTTTTGINVCTGSSSAMITANLPAGGFMQSTSFGTNLQSPGPATNFNITVPALPPGAVITSTTLKLTTVNSINGSWRSEARVALSGATTLPATQLSLLNSGGIITPDPNITIPNLPLAGGAVTLTLSETFDDGGAGTIDATYANAEIVINYTLPITIDWYDAASGGTLQGSGSPFETIGTTLLPDGNTSGTYTFYAGYNLSGCPSNLRVPADVVISDVVVALSPVDITCNGANNGSFTLGTVTCGNPGFTYSVDGGSFGPIPTNLTPGTHNVIVMDTVGGLSDNIAISISQPSWTVPSPAVTNAVICVGDPSAILTGSVSIADTVTLVLPFNVISQPVETNAPPGNIVATATLPAIPGTVISAVLSYPNLQTLGFSWMVDIHLGFQGAVNDPADFDPVVPFGGGTFDYLRIIPNAAVNNSGGSVDLLYWDDLDDNIGDEATFPTGPNAATLTIKYLPSANISWWDAATAGTNLANNDSIESVGTSVLPNTNTPGVYNFYAEAEYNGCYSSSRTLATTTVGAYPIVNLGPDSSYCVTHDLDAGNPGMTFLWNDASTTQMITALDTGIYWVDVTSTLGCTTRDSINLTINPLPVVDLGPDTSSCGSYTLDPGPQYPGSTYLWNDLSTNPTLTTTTSGDYDVTVTDVNGCSNSDTVTVNVPPITYNDLGPDTTLCTNASGFTLDATAVGVTYLWQDGSTNSTYFVDLPGTYWCTITNFVGCTYTDSVIVTSVNPIQTNIGVNFITMSSATLDAGSGYASYLWSTSASTQVITVNANGQYYVEVMDANNCITTDTVNIVFSLGVFNPNGTQTTMTLYPNPSEGVFSVAINNLETSDLVMEILDMNGRVILNKYVGSVSGSLIEPFNMATLRAGMYNLRLTANGKSSTLRFVVK